MSAAMNTAMAIANVCILFGMLRLLGYLAACCLHLIGHFASWDHEPAWLGLLNGQANSRPVAFLRAMTIASLTWVMATMLLWVIVAITPAAVL